MKVIDVSEHNGKIDYKKVKSDGVEGVIIRAGYGKGNVDKKFTSNITGAIKNGLNIGIYWFSYAYTVEMAKREAQFCNDIIAPYKININLPVFFDWEYDSAKFSKKNGVNADKDLITDMTAAFCGRTQELGFTSGYYLNLDYAKNYYNEDRLTEYKRWFARYIKGPVKDCYLWQQSSAGVVNGISGNVDMNTLWGDLTDLEGQVDDLPKDALKPVEKDETAPQGYIIGKVYTVSVNTALNVRKGPGTNYIKVTYNGLTNNARKYATKSGALKPGTRVTCLETKTNNNSTWMRIPSGWICAEYNKIKYVK